MKIKNVFASLFLVCAILFGYAGYQEQVNGKDDTAGVGYFNSTAYAVCSVLLFLLPSKKKTK